MRIVPALLAGLLIAGCGARSSPDVVSNTSSAEPRRSVSSDLPNGVKPSSDILEMRKIAGVWRSAPGVLKAYPSQIVQLEIAFDKSFSLTLWGKDPQGKGQAVFARQQGHIGRRDKGFAGSADKAQPGPLAVLATWTGVLSQDGTLEMSGVGSGGLKVPLRRSGS